MSLLWTQADQTTPPVGNASTNRANPIARGLRHNFRYQDNSGRDSLSGLNYAWSAPSSAVASGSIGGIGVASTGVNRQSLAPSRLSASDVPVTVRWVFVYSGTSSLAAFFRNPSGNVCALYLNSPTAGLISAYNGSWVGVGGSTALVAGRVYDVVMVKRGSGGTADVYINGQLEMSGIAFAPSAFDATVDLWGDGFSQYHDGAKLQCQMWERLLDVGEITSLARKPWQLFEADNDPAFYTVGGATDYPVTASDALTLADSASNVASLGAAGSDALTLADSVSNVAALSATATDALTLADSASNVAALSATATDALTLADTLNATASGDYTATGSDALTLADSAANAAALGATGTDALTLADAASNTAALGATAADALTLADTLNASATGDYVVVATDALSLSDSVAAAYTAICIATDALSLADATSAAMAGEYAATATDALVLADAVSNAAALGVSISEALTLAVLVSALNPGQLVLGVRGRPGVQIQTGTRRN